MSLDPASRWSDRLALHRAGDISAVGATGELRPADGGARCDASAGLPRSGAVCAVRFVQLLYAAGLPSKAILHILPFLDTLVATPEMTQRLTDERDRIQARLHDLTRARDRLDELIGIASQYTESSPAQCPVRSLGDDIAIDLAVL